MVKLKTPCKTGSDGETAHAVGASVGDGDVRRSSQRQEIEADTLVRAGKKGGPEGEQLLCLFVDLECTVIVFSEEHEVAERAEEVTACRENLTGVVEAPDDLFQCFSRGEAFVDDVVQVSLPRGKFVVGKAD
jgi:hypothetical protein